MNPIPLMTAQHRPLALVTEPGIHGGRVSFIGPRTHEVVADFVTPDEAHAAKVEAVAYVAAWWAAKRVRT